MIYEKPEMEFLRLLREDVICGSNGELNNVGGSDSWDENADIGDL